MRLSIIIPAYNEAKTIPSLLRSIAAQRRKPDEVIVVDNNSSDTTQQVVHSLLPNAIVLIEKQQGAIYAREKGFQAATGDVLCRTDADCVLPTDWCERIESKFIENQSLAGLTGTIKYVEPPTKWLGGLPSWVMYYVLTIIFRMGILYGPNLAITKRAYLKITPCVERSHFGDLHEDFDLGQHIAKVGKIVFDPKLFVYSSARRIQGKPMEFFGTYTKMLYHNIFQHNI